ncbi:MAG: TonB-dependent receptor plug [Limisphaerales bacterium]|nr:MAG: TonB-dependent receptor plug [Limisphaerales bacterium]
MRTLTRPALARLTALLTGLAALAPRLPAAAPPKPDLTALSLEELGQIRITSVSKKAEPLVQAPAAIHVLTQDDLHRSGATSLAEALRLVPGLQVARQNAHTWAISARGFNDTFANKLIRGPGSALWGANAVNGVINIITKRAQDTPGTLVTLGGGTEDQGMIGVRHGVKLADELFLRLYGKGLLHGHSARFASGDANDEWRQARGGFRLDWDPADENRFTFQGDAYGGGLHQTLTSPTLVAPFTSTAEQTGRVHGGNFLARWTRTLGPESDLRVQTYYDHTFRDEIIFGEARDALDFEVQHRFPVGERHELIWGADYRLTSDDVFRQSFDVSLGNARETRQLVGGFLQDQVELIPDRLKLTLGAKVEHNDYTGWSLQPSARLAWTPHEQHHLWAAVSRAVRTPSRAERTVRLNATASPGPTLVSLFGSSALGDEHLVAYELGHRWQPRPDLAFDTALFHHEYSRLLTTETGTPFLEPTPAPAHVTVPLTLANLGRGETYGAELTGRWQPVENWRLTASYAHLSVQLHTRPGSTDTSQGASEGASPRHTVTLRSAWDLPRNLVFDSTLRYVDNLRGVQIPAYLALDARLAWKPRPNLELAVVGQNLLDPLHPEYQPRFIRTDRTEVGRAVHGRITWTF